MRSELQLAVATGGIYFFYLYYGILQERIYKPDEQDGTRFGFTLFLLSVQCLFNFALGGIMSLVLDGGRLTQKKPVSASAETAPLGLRFSGTAWLAFFSATYLAAMSCSNMALQHVSYPFQALAKSCKMVPVMLANVVLGGKSYSVTEYLIVLMITGGVVLFRLAKSKQGFGMEGNSAMGLTLLAGSLCLDGVTGSSQRLFSSEFKPSSNFLMAGMNFFSLLYVVPVVLYTGEFFAAVDYVQAHPAVTYDLIAFSVCSAVGQVFIFYSVVTLGPLATTTITTTRKFFTVLLSTILYPENQFNNGQWFAVALVFAGLGSEIVQKYARTQDKQIAKKDE
ncbi:UDP-galactose transporter-like 1 [Hondaea fermentalgiana]|uniref:UDP-galactose transporter-like 1 n=1 Tax=Hondaea fermentalgiana TaxID=2315210 RepID=A0A2R5GMI8_9STRA|nr:UDP-galactose transporter-like 1 [Hondaea fermentalgiana]|eukprot:GBG31519.1 UDP-galactose transporter-like 1 [Hondaea fermentalgiana]